MSDTNNRESLMSKNEKKQAVCWMTGTKFEIGDIVTRGGDDRQKIIDIGDVGDMIEVECIKEPLGYPNEDGSRGEPWCKLGDREWNLTRRYSFPEIEPIEPLTSRYPHNYEFFHQTMLNMAAWAITEGMVTYGTQSPALSESARQSLQALSSYIQAETRALTISPVLEAEAAFTLLGNGSPNRARVAAEFGMDVEDIDTEIEAALGWWQEPVDLCHPNGGDA
jgi:hypothetical protein